MTVHRNIEPRHIAVATVVAGLAATWPIEIRFSVEEIETRRRQLCVAIQHRGQLQAVRICQMMTRQWSRNVAIAAAMS